jgi:hypothetical protein
VLDKISKYKADLVRHVSRMERSRHPEALSNYIPRCLKSREDITDDKRTAGAGVSRQVAQLPDAGSKAFAM